MPSVFNSTSGTWRRAAFITFHALISFIAAAFFSFAVDPGGAERDPYHSHIVVGGTPEEQARTLAEHRRLGHFQGWAWAVNQPARTTPIRDGGACRGTAYLDADQGARVLSFRSGEAEASVIGLGSGAILTVPWHLLTDEQPVARVASPFTGSPPDIVLPVPKPPPKLA